jgi:hypothetical protein
MLEAWGEDIWVVSAPLSIGPLRLGTRMTVVRLPSGGLWLCSPVEATDALVEEVGELGPVEFIVAPNLYHHLYLRGWDVRFPDAQLLGPPGLAEKRPRLRFDGTLGADAPAAWGDALASHLVQGLKANEAVFLHRPSRTLVLTDLAFQMDSSGPARLFWKLNGVDRRFGPSRLIRFMVDDRATFSESIRAISRWDFERVIIAHGTPIRTDGHRRFTSGFAHFLESGEAS